jgi:hypothetical protein
MKKRRLRSKRSRTYPDAIWKERLASVVKAQRAVTRAEERARDFVEGHMLRHPLTEEQKERLIARVSSGGAICCAGGLRWLRQYFDSVWTRALNGWAYESLSCQNSHERGEQTEHREKLEGVLERGIPRYYFL